MDLHRHSEHSLFDGYGKAEELAQLAVELGHTALGISDHGTMSGLVQHYTACKKAGIKPVLGIEGYFLPVYKEKERGYHLCLFAKNHTGYANLNRLQFEGEKIKYFNPIWTFELLEQYHEGIICTSACVAGYLGQCLKDDKIKQAEKYVKKMVEIFGDDFYIEIQPYKITEHSLQEKVNVNSYCIAKKYGVKCILTSDSHRGKKEDFSTYLKMHEISGHREFGMQYKERYMPTDRELYERFVKMHEEDFPDAKRIGKQMVANLKEIEDKVEDDIFSGLKQLLPVFSNDSLKLFKRNIKQGMVKRGKWTHDKDGLDYIARIEEEVDVIVKLGFYDYFLIVADYVNWAKDNGICVGPGRGSVCNCLVAYALGITEVDSLLFNLEFSRFLHEDKKKLPDIDLDFETARRDEVIRYVINRYKGKTARVAAYGLYKIDNLINDLAKVCGLETDKSVDSEFVKQHKTIIAEIKKLCREHIQEDGSLNVEKLLHNQLSVHYNEMYDNIILHFSKLYMKLRYIGTHAAGVIVTGGDLFDYSTLRLSKDGDVYTNYDLNDLEVINLVKFDMLGLGTMEEIGELREITGDTVDYDSVVRDKNVLRAFNSGNSQAVFQFDKRSVRQLLQSIDCNCFDDIMAANAMNRPGPLALKMPELYAQNKHDLDNVSNSPYFEFSKESYGTLIYQEQTLKICSKIGGYTKAEADKFLKLTKHGYEVSVSNFQKEKENGDDMKGKFFSNAKKYGMTKKQTEELWDALMVYAFNKGHACGYSLISVEEMYYKVYYPTEFWFGKIKYAPNEDVYDKYCSYAVQDGCVVFLSHINYSKVKASMRKVEGEYCIQRGLADIKGVGEKAAVEIVAERKRGGIFTSWDNFYDRCKSRVCNIKVMKIIKEQGAAEFNKRLFISRVTKYNSALLGRVDK